MVGLGLGNLRAGWWGVGVLGLGVYRSGHVGWLWWGYFSGGLGGRPHPNPPPPGEGISEREGKGISAPRRGRGFLGCWGDFWVLAAFGLG